MQQMHSKAAENGWTPPRDRRWTMVDGVGMAKALAASGGVIGRFARQHGINEQRVRWWRDRIRQAGPAATVRFAPVRLVETAAARPQVDTAVGLEVSIGDAVVHVRAGFDAGLLRSVVDALRSR
jgi:transposase-like protein